MDLTSLLIVAAIAVLAIAFIVRPLANGDVSALSEEERRHSTLQAAHEQALAALVEMDADYAMGKIEAEDYRRDRAVLLARGSQVLREIDQARPVASSDGGEWEAEVEARVARLRGDGVRGDPFCTQCGSRLQPGDRFCSRCGTPVSTVEARA